MIRGWELGIIRMSLNEEARLEIPSALGYGKKGMGPIPPHSDLEFQVRVVRVCVRVPATQPRSQRRASAARPPIFMAASQRRRNQSCLRGSIRMAFGSAWC